MKKFISLLLIFTLVFNAFTFVSAEEHKQPKVVIQDIENVPDNIIQDIIKENPNVGQITILEYKKCSEDKSMPINNKNTKTVMGALGKTYYDIEKTVTDTDVLTKNAFVTSVAKGQSITLSSKWSASIKCSISGDISSSNLGITSSLTKSYSKTEKFDGPPENSKYNSRKYKVKFYAKKGTYTARWSTGTIGSGTLKFGNESGNYIEPDYYVSYSIDSYVN